MKEVILQLPDQTYDWLSAEAASAHTSLEQWILDKLSHAPGSKPSVAEPHVLLAAALEALGFKRLNPEKAQRLSELLAVRKARSLSNDESTELNALMAEANALELTSLERLAAALSR